MKLSPEKTVYKDGEISMEKAVRSVGRPAGKTETGIPKEFVR